MNSELPTNEKLSAHEIKTLVSIFRHESENNRPPTKAAINAALKNSGCTAVEVSIALLNLANKGLIKKCESLRDGGHLYLFTNEGEQWVLENQDLFKKTQPDDIAF
jgi:hypothetical protein